MFKAAFIGTSVLGVALLAQEPFSPARYRAGAVPASPVMAVGGGEVVLELDVSHEGRVIGVTPLRTTPPFTSVVADAVRDWEFAPAEQDARSEPRRPDAPASRIRVASKVLVAAIFRPPALLGPTFGEAPRDVATPSDETPFPVSTTVPTFPPRALGGGVVLLELLVDRTGAVDSITVIRSAAPFDDAARDAVARWSFRPARVGGMAVPTLVYVVLGFRVPIGAAATVPSTNPL